MITRSDVGSILYQYQMQSCNMCGDWQQTATSRNMCESEACIGKVLAMGELDCKPVTV